MLHLIASITLSFLSSFEIQCHTFLQVAIQYTDLVWRHHVLISWLPPQIKQSLQSQVAPSIDQAITLESSGSLHRSSNHSRVKWIPPQIKQSLQSQVAPSIDQAITLESSGSLHRSSNHSRVKWIPPQNRICFKQMLTTVSKGWYSAIETGALCKFVANSTQAVTKCLTFRAPDQWDKLTQVNPTNYLT